MRRDRCSGLAAGLCLGLLALGPGLRRGFLLSYDMVFVPREPFSAALPGLAPPRAVPSDLIVAVASRVIPADIVQKLVLLSIFLLACSGAAVLLDREPVIARLAAGVFYAWNPYVAERLIIGQWALLLGYAGLPWVLRAVLRPELASWRGTGRFFLALLPAVIGGFAAMTITALVVVPAVVARREVRAAAVALGALALGSLPWLVPSLLHPVYADPAGVAAFAARADTPFGTIGSLLMLGGTWNAQTVPKAYGGAWSALWLALTIAGIAGYALLAWRQRRWPGLGVAGAAGLVIASIGATAPGRNLLRGAIGAWPGFAVLRDGQQFVAPLALAEAAGFGLAVTWAMNPRSFGAEQIRRAGRHQRPAAPDGAGLALGVIALLAPVVLLPGLAWGAGGRLRPVGYPASWLAAARLIDQSPVPGAVLLLPWATDRKPQWNDNETMLDPWPRLLSREVIWNDGTQVGDVRMAPDDLRARQLGGVINSAGLPEALRAAGVRFVVVDSGGPIDRGFPGWTTLTGQPGLWVYELPG